MEYKKAEVFWVAITFKKHNNLPNKTQCVGFFTRNYKAKHDTIAKKSA